VNRRRKGAFQGNTRTGNIINFLQKFWSQFGTTSFDRGGRHRYCKNLRTTQMSRIRIPRRYRYDSLRFIALQASVNKEESFA
jgi:hypothetical protein